MKLPDAAQAILTVGNFINSKGWAPATAGNYSMRIDADRIAITVSGVHKGHLIPDHIMTVDGNGASLDGKMPSAETLLHTSLYNLYPEVNAILHTHSIANTVLSRMMHGDALVLEGYELLKAFPGITTHQTKITLPIVDNSQDIASLAKIVEARLKAMPAPAYIIRGHGIYTWGRTMAEAKNALEALEFLLECDMWERRLRA